MLLDGTAAHVKLLRHLWVAQPRRHEPKYFDLAGGKRRSLRRAGILQSQRGVKGGYSFTREPGQVTVLEVVEALEGSLDAETIGADPLWADAIGALREKLAAITIAEIAERESRAAGAQMYYI